MTRDHRLCDWCREPFPNNARLVHMLDKKMILSVILSEPNFAVHVACAYELRDELNVAIQAIEAQAQLEEEESN